MCVLEKSERERDSFEEREREREREPLDITCNGGRICRVIPLKHTRRHAVHVGVVERDRQLMTGSPGPPGEPVINCMHTLQCVPFTGS